MKIIWSPTARTKTKEILEYSAEDNPDAALTRIFHQEFFSHSDRSFTPVSNNGGLSTVSL